MPKNMKLLCRHLALFCAIAVVVATCGCPIYELLGITCPLCGTTRAWISFVTGEIGTAFWYHPLFLITPFWFFAAVHYESILKKNKAIGAFLILIAFLLAILNILRVFHVIDGPV